MLLFNAHSLRTAGLRKTTGCSFFCRWYFCSQEDELLNKYVFLKHRLPGIRKASKQYKTVFIFLYVAFQRPPVDNLCAEYCFP